MNSYQSYLQPYMAENESYAYTPPHPTYDASYPDSEYEYEDEDTVVEIESEPTFWGKICTPFKRRKSQCTSKNRGVTTYQVGGAGKKNKRSREEQRQHPAQAPYPQSHAQGPYPPSWQPTHAHPQAPPMPMPMPLPPHPNFMPGRPAPSNWTYPRR